MPDIRFTNNAVLHSNNFIPISRTAWNYFLVLTNSGERDSGIRFVRSISFDSIRFARMSHHNFVFFSFLLFYRFIAFNVCKLVRGFISLKIFPMFKDGASSKILRFLPVIFSSQRSRQKKKEAGERRKGNNGGNDGEMKERNGWGKDPRENRRTGSWPTAAFCPLFPSLIGARYLLLPFTCMGKKERKEWTKAIDIVNDRIFLWHHSSINPHIIWFFQLYVLFDSLREVWRQFDSEENGRKSLKFRKKCCGVERQEYCDIFAWISINFGRFLISWTRLFQNSPWLFIIMLLQLIFLECLSCFLLFLTLDKNTTIRSLYLIFDNIIEYLINRLFLYSFLNFHLIIEFHKVQWYRLP